MPGMERLLIGGYPHHLVRKCRDKQIVFHNDADYLHCLGQIRELRDQYGLKVHAWCLLPDKLHILVTPPQRPKQLSVFMKALSCRTSLRRKEIHDECSPWDPRYKSSPVEPRQWFLACMCYIETLPVLYGLATSAFQYRWSSYRMRLGKTSSYWLDDREDYLSLGDSLAERAKAYSHYLRSGIDEKEVKVINKAIDRNWLTGSPRFQEVLKAELGITIQEPRPRGRPRKNPIKKQYDVQDIL